MGGVRIGELADRTGFAESQIRFYERRGLLPSPPRTAAGYRVYGEPDVARLRLLGQAKRLGLPLAQVREVLTAAEHGCCDETDQALRAAVRRRIAEIDQQLSQLRQLRAALARALHGQAPARPHAERDPARPNPKCGDGACLPDGTAQAPGATPPPQLPLLPQ